MTTKSLINLGSWVPINRKLANALGNDAARVYAELLAFKELHKNGLDDGWFYLSLAKLGQRAGLNRKPLERSLKLLNDAELLITVTQGSSNLTHYKMAENINSFAHIGQTLRPKRAKPTPKTDKGFDQNGQRVCPKGANNILNQEYKIEILNQNTKSEIENVARKKTDEENGLTVAPQKQKKPISKKEKSRGLTSFYDAAGRLIDHLNAVAGSRFRHVAVNLDAFARVLHAAEGTEEEVRWVIEFKTMQWKDKPDMSHNLNPETLCRPSNFPRYLEQMHSARHQVQQGTYGKTQQEIATEQAFYQGAVNFVPPHLRKY
jgi:uncharacterized phage protein (TIGR02220 family)